MIYGQNRTELRKVFVTAWQKHLHGETLEPLEKMIADLLVVHPEYHAFFADDSALDKDFVPEAGEVNPFLHLGMHLSLQEQLNTDRPAGIVALFQQMVQKNNDAHRTEHQMMECLGEILWQAQNTGQAPDEIQYLECIRKRL